jgi:hypothetical protein
MTFSFIHLITKEFKHSKWMDVLDKLMRIRDDECRDYEVKRHTLAILFSFAHSFSESSLGPLSMVKKNHNCTSR